MLVAVLLAAASGGWRRLVGAVDTGFYVVSDDALASAGQSVANGLPVSGGLLLVGSATLLVVAAIRGRRWGTALLSAVMTIAFLGWLGLNSARLGYTTVVFRSVPSGSDFDGQVEISITLWVVVALLLGFQLLLALAWAARGSWGPATERETERMSPWAAILVLAVALPLPRAARWLRDGIRSAAGVDASDLAGFGLEGEQALCLLMLAIIVLVVAAGVLARRAPSVALAATLVLAPLWLPAWWLLGGLTLPDVIADSVGATLATWAAWIALGATAARQIRNRTIAAG